MRNRIVAKIEQREGRPIRDIIIDLYRKHGNQTRVAAELGISQPRLSQLIQENGLRIKQIVVPDGGNAA